MKRAKKFLALVLAGAMTVSLAACGAAEQSAEPAATTETTAEGATEETAAAEEASTGSDTPLVIAADDFSEKFSPFFSNSVPDTNVQAMTQVLLLGNDRAGEIIYNGIEGETKTWNGTDYFYQGVSDCTVTENADGTVLYEFKLRDDLKFSDGEPVTADDVIFTMYAYLDPSYDGATSLYSLPIEGLEAYRSGAEPLWKVMYKNGDTNTDFSLYTEEQQKQFFEVDLPAAGAAFAQDITDYCVANYGDYFDASVSSDVANAMTLWGYGSIEDGVLTAPSGKTWDLASEEHTTAEWCEEILAAYDYDLEHATATEKANASFTELLDVSYLNTVETGASADHITGITKVDDYTVDILLTEVDATAIYSLAVYVTPLHYYGDTSLYDYENNKFGFVKGDLSSVRAKTTVPLGAGPYKFVKYENKTVYMEANDLYFKGAPKTKNLQWKVTSNPDKTPGVVQGTIDISDPSASKDALAQIAGENSNGEITGDKLTTILTDTRGYGYIGMNSQNVKVGDDGSSEESKNLRKAIATVLSVYRDVVIDSYYGEAASVINYPISNTSWAAPQASDPDYAIAFSTDVNGDPIYTDGMSQEEKEAAALEAALGFFEAAGYTVEDGKLTAAPAGAEMSYEVLIGGSGQGDHPSFGILTAASEALKTIGFDLVVTDLSDSSQLWSATEGGTADLWCAAWQTTIDPDMFQIYHSEGGSAYMYRIYSDELDELVEAGRTNTDQAYRKAIYKEALDFVVDYAVEIPVYQRQDLTLISTERVKVDSLCPDMTTYYSYLDEIETVEMN